MRTAAAMNATGRYGNPKCPCVGLDFAKGTLQLIGHDKILGYPSDTGAHCEAWDQGRASECEGAPGEGPDFCGEQWCYVDPCNCAGIEAPPRVSHHMADVLRQGMPVYYSYSTCGGKDTWTVSHNDRACLNAKTADACGQHEDCIWEKSEWGSMCLGWEAAGLCGGAPEAETWGLETCPCIGMNGINGTVEVQIGGGAVAEYPIDLASVCKAWDMDHSPLCKGDDKAAGCDQPWCYVDTARCTKAKTKESTYLPGAKYQGRPLHYSYETCGGKVPAEPVQHDHQDEVEAEAEEEAEGAGPGAEGAEPDAGEAEEAPAEEGTDVKYDHDKYLDEWHNEWKNGKVEAFRDMHPEIKEYVDRQSDGVPSPVG